MATVAGKNWTVTINSNNLSANVRNCSLNFTIETGDDTALGDTAHTRIPLLKDVSFDIDGMWDAAATLADVTLGALYVTPASVTCSLSPDGGTTTYAGAAIMTTYNPSAAVDGTVDYSASFEGNGAWTRT